jgi:uroporphyrinogen-III synthase
MNSVKVLSTKKLWPALIQKAKQNAIDIFEKEFINIRCDITETVRKNIHILSDKNIVAVFTSSNAVDAVASVSNNGRWKICCIGGKTKEAVVTNFINSQVIAIADNAAELANTIIASGINEVVFFCGDQRRDELPLLLLNAKIKLEELSVYSTIETPVIIHEPFDVVLFFSPTAVRSFFSMNQLSASAICFAIGNTTAEEIKLHSGNKIFIAETPSQESLINELINYYKQPVRS